MLGAWWSRKGNYWGENVWRCALDEVIILGRLGNQQPHGRRVITPAHEGAVSSVWQSTHNSGLIHHMGIMPLTGTTPKKSYTRFSPASEHLNNPIPLLSTHGVWSERERANEQELLTERKHICLGPCSTEKAAHLCSVRNGCVLVIHAFSFPLRITLASSANGIDNRH